MGNDISGVGDRMKIRTDIPPLGVDYSKEEEEGEYAGADPSVSRVWGGFV